MWATTSGGRVGPTWEAAGAAARSSARALVPKLTGCGPRGGECAVGCGTTINSSFPGPRARGGTWRLRAPQTRVRVGLSHASGMRSSQKACLGPIFLVPHDSPSTFGRCMTVHFTGEGKEAQRG